jgi:hypothetical protein
MIRALGAGDLSRAGEPELSGISVGPVGKARGFKAAQSSRPPGIEALRSSLGTSWGRDDAPHPHRGLGLW